MKWTFGFGALLALILLVLLGPSVSAAGTDIPTKRAGAQGYARSDDEFARAIVLDLRTGAVLYEYQADKRWPAASLTKLMSALVFMDHHPRWTAVVKMAANDEVGGGRLRISTGATLSALDLLYSSITASANNTAAAMARVSGLGTNGFIRAMNKKAKALGLKHTSFVDPSGIDPKNVTTAREIAKLAIVAYNVDTIRRSATTATYRFRIRNTGEIKQIKNTNDLLVSKEHDDVYVTGGKTGFLYESRFNLAVRMKPIGAKGMDRHLMVVVLGSPTREDSFKTAKSLANWAWKAYTWSP